MASLDFDLEKQEFRDFYADNFNILEDAKTSFCALINALVSHGDNIAISKIDGRVKDKEECIRKFNLKYRKNLESEGLSYSIKKHITDLIGLRVVCLYEDDIEKIKNVLSRHFEVIDVTDKISLIEKTEGSFGYKGLHLDLKLGVERKGMPEYRAYADFNFEVQIRTIIQDSWSVLDHKIKYKKSIPNRLKRRINTLAALFELADREFREIRAATEEEIRKAEEELDEIPSATIVGPQLPVSSPNGRSLLNAFGFLKIAKHFFRDFEFEPHKVDGFTEEIVSLEPEITKYKFNLYMKDNVAKVKLYKACFEANSNSAETLNPYTMIRHCLYLGDREKFSAILTNNSKEAFEQWLACQPE
jgi:ppGpp synthetase/RelA/SpoT-type nucleotidyltranferase